MSNIKERVNDFVKTFLSEIHNRNFSQKSKFIHDPLWGTIELFPHELAILETSLIQRLRYIHQTGFVYETFPSAQHSRFEHTLGVLHLAGKIAKLLRDRYSTKVKKESIYLVRLAALLHDSGHSAFSHTTEELYEGCEDIRQLIEKGGEFENKGAGEVLSYLIATSEAFTSFFAILKSKYTCIKDIEVEDFATLILGRPRTPDKLFEAQIISGSFDADKLDYFPRDGRAVGINLSLDIDRLLHCMEIRRVDNKNSLVVNRGGYNSIQQLLFARASLTASVYHHHKVRACDCMAKACFKMMDEEEKFFNIRDNKGLTLKHASDYLYITDQEFLSEGYNHATSNEIHNLIHGIQYRRLFKRALVISATTIKNFTSSTAEAGYSQFYSMRTNPKLKNEFETKIFEKSKVNCSKFHICVDIPKNPTFNKAGSALISHNQSVMPLSKLIPVDKWVETYKQYHTQSYIFAPDNNSIRKKVSDAAREVLSSEFGIHLYKAASPDNI